MDEVYQLIVRISKSYYKLYINRHKFSTFLYYIRFDKVFYCVTDSNLLLNFVILY